MGSTTLGEVELDQLRLEGDLEVDGIVADLHRRSGGVDCSSIPEFFRQVRSDPARAPHLIEWLDDNPPLPDWATNSASTESIERGQQFFRDWALPVSATLFCASLPEAYAAENGAHVLRRASLLADHEITRRIAETGQMLVDVMDLDKDDPRTLQPGGGGYCSARHVRLLHAFVRDCLLQAAGEQSSSEAAPTWSDAWGYPINQEDLLGTLFTFTTVVVRSMNRLGIPVRRDEAEAYLHAWCVVGVVLGVKPELLPIGYEDAERLADAIARRQQRRSEDGRYLMRVLLNELELAMPFGFRKLPRTLVRQLVGKEIADMLEVPRSAWWRPALRAFAAGGRFLVQVPGGRRLMQVPSGVIGRSMFRMYIDRARIEPAFHRDEDRVERLEAFVGGMSAPRVKLRQRRRRIRTRKMDRTRVPVAATSALAGSAA